MPKCGRLDHAWHPLKFALGLLAFMLPALLIAAAALWPRTNGNKQVAAASDPIDRRIITLLAFGPVATVLALSAITGRGAIAMWGYPLWLLLGLWIVMP